MDLSKIQLHGWIFARGGSRGLPRKNLMKLDGRSLIGHAAEQARSSKYIKEIFISTDCPEIAECARAEGVRVPFLRPAELATDTAPEHLAWQHAVNWNRQQNEFPRMDIMVSLPPTSPLRTAEEIDRGIELFLEGGADTVIAVSRSNRHPAFNMICLNEDQSIRLAMPRPAGLYRRQDAEPIFNIATAFYIVSTDFILSSNHYLEGLVKALEIPPAHAIDIDDMLDFKLCTLLMEDNK